MLGFGVIFSACPEFAGNSHIWARKSRFRDGLEGGLCKRGLGCYVSGFLVHPYPRRERADPSHRRQTCPFSPAPPPLPTFVFAISLSLLLLFFFDFISRTSLLLASCLCMHSAYSPSNLFFFWPGLGVCSDSLFFLFFLLFILLTARQGRLSEYEA